MDLGLAGKKAIVCASSQGLGRGCALALAKAGCQIVINGRNGEALAKTAREIQALTDTSVIPVQADVSTTEGKDALFEACPDADILINNNGGPPRKNYEQITQDEMMDGLLNNMVTPIELLNKFVPGMKQRRFGRIVNITSSSVLSPIAGLDLSSGARAGLTAFLAGVARELAPFGITINNLLPGKMDTKRLRSGLQLTAEKSGKTEQETADQQMAAIPVKRFGNPEEFGQVCAFLCSQHAGYLVGQNILLDGGLINSTF